MLASPTAKATDTLPVLDDPPEQPAVFRRERARESARCHHNRKAACRQRAAVGHAVDPLGPTGEHGDTAPGQPRRKLEREQRRALGRIAGADDSDARPAWQLAAQVQHRRGLAQLGKAGRETGAGKGSLAGQDHAACSVAPGPSCYFT